MSVGMLARHRVRILTGRVDGDRYDVERLLERVGDRRSDVESLVGDAIGEYFRKTRRRRIGIARADQFEYQARLAYRGANLFLGIRLVTRRQIATHHERNFRLDARHTGDRRDGTRRAHGDGRGVDGRQDDGALGSRHRAFPTANGQSQQFGDSTLNCDGRGGVGGTACFGHALSRRARTPCTDQEVCGGIGGGSHGFLRIQRRASDNPSGTKASDAKLPISTIDATFAGSWLYCSATMKLRTAGGRQPNRISRPCWVWSRRRYGASSAAIAMPVSGHTSAPITPRFQPPQVTVAMRAPSEISISGIIASPVILMATISQSGSGGCTSAKAKPTNVAITIGLRKTGQNAACRLTMCTPTVNCSRFEIVNSATIAERPACPNASAASGSPMLPQLLNIIGGTKVRVSSCSSLANGHASSPEPTTTPIAPRINARLAYRSNSLLASALKINAGASTLRLIWFTQVMSGLARLA